MPRFSLPRFLRRQTSGKNDTGTLASATTASFTPTTHTGTDTRTSTPTTPPAIAHASPTLPLHQPTAHSPRRSASATGIRDKFLERTGVEAPASVAEVPESALLETADPRRRSGSETLADSADIAGTRGGVPAEALKLEHLEDTVPPTLTLEEPTPDLYTRDGQAPGDVAGRRQDSTSPLHRALSLHSARGPSPKSPAKLDTLGSRDRTSSTPSSSSTVSPGTTPARIVSTLIDAPPKRHPERPQTPTSALLTSAAFDYFTPGLPNMASMLHRKIWVRRPGASATLVQIRVDELVDDVRDMILKKYANSLGRTFDSPDVTLRVLLRAEPGHQRHERLLGPEEDMCRAIDSYYPGGQTVDDALIIDVPQRRTPRPSPKPYLQNINYAAGDEYRPQETANDYFPPMPAMIPPTVPQTCGSHDSRGSHHLQHHNPSIVAPPLDPHQRSISVLNTGQLPPLPSPGGTRRTREHRPRYHRQQTTSPTAIMHPASSISGPAGNLLTNNVPNAAPANLNPAYPLVQRVSGRPRLDSSASEAHALANGVPLLAPVPLPTPPILAGSGASAEGSVGGTSKLGNGNGSSPPTPSGQGVPPNTVAGGHRFGGRPRKTRKPTPDRPLTSRSRNGLGHLREDSQSTTPPSASNMGVRSASTMATNMFDGSVPPINVLIVEDNIINLRILEGLMKRLKVRWQTAMNGQIAVDKYKKGGFHLVLMDIQMPVMNGLQATKEIRRLESVNGIGVFSSSAGTSPLDGDGAKGKERKAEDDQLAMSEGSFKSPVIIVALTASSLQSDRHEALAAGCNDFLTKPVNFVWLERKVKEWGCMQALIDFDGWRKWKDFAAREAAGMTEEERRAEREKEERMRGKMEKFAKLQERQKEKGRREEEERRRKRASLMGGEGGASMMDGLKAAEGGEVVV
ncbi:hypothetical protein LTR08_002310 [Meristemomyces frigidus]|nr:hypothetical protein LTR08_002310 [Meristemomyces frigidus]